MSVKRCIAVVVCGWVAVYVLGCVTTHLPPMAPPPDPTVYHEWRVVYEVKTPTDRVVIGFVDHEVSEEESGVYYILDRDHRRRGFMLPSGTTFAFERGHDGLQTVDLGNLGLERAVKELLGTRETIALLELRDANFP